MIGTVHKGCVRGLEEEEIGGRIFKDYLNYTITKISLNAEISGDLRRFAVTRTPLTFVLEYLARNNIIVIISEYH